MGLNGTPINRFFNDNGVEDTHDGPKTDSIFFDRPAATGRERSNGVRNKNDAAEASMTAYLPPRVVDQPGANGINDKTARAWPHSVTMIASIQR